MGVGDRKYIKTVLPPVDRAQDTPIKLVEFTSKDGWFIIMRPMRICMLRGRLAMTGNGGKGGISGNGGCKQHRKQLTQ